MGAVYRARDAVTGRTLALKRLIVEQERRRELFTALFEREYHTLAQLSHPSVIEVFDYGVDAEGPYYTMELLEGHDLQRSSALPPREVCGILHDVASCLSLLHARRLVHRDVTRRNVRIVAPGRAKLIDFGALTPMGTSEQIVGTPMYIAPEAVLMQPLDGRVDLYSLGVVLYHALTGRYPYPARSVGELRASWRLSPAPPHELSSDVPPALSNLALSLIALERDARPRDAAEVMERLSAIGELERDEPVGASRAYLTTPTLVGRGAALRRTRAMLLATIRGHGAGLLFSGPPGVGRTRMLDAAVLEAKVLGAAVVRVGAPHGQRGDFSAMQALVEQLQALEPRATAAALPDDLRDGSVELARAGVGRAQRIAALRALFAGVARRAPVVIAADDVHLLDEPSVAALATLLQDIDQTRVALLCSLPSTHDAPESLGLRLLVERSKEEALEPLQPDAMQKLMRSIFGAVPHAHKLADRLHRLSRGYPRDAMALAEHLLDQGAISYRAGSFVLPATLEADALPSSVSAALAQRARALRPLARALAQAHALSARRSTSLEDCLRLARDRSAAEVHRALDELVAADVLTIEGADYVLRHEGWGAALLDLLDDAGRAQHHRSLARLLEDEGRDPLALAYHLMHAGEHAEAARRVASFATEHEAQAIEMFGMTRLRTSELGWLFSRASEALEGDGEAHRRTLGLLDYFMMTLGVLANARWFLEAAPAVEEDLAQDAGYRIWQALDPTEEPMPRLLRALSQAQADYEAAPHQHRFAPAEAIRHLVQYVVASIAVGARTLNAEVRRHLPPLLEPFAPLSPAIDAMLENCRSAAESTYSDYESASERLVRVVEALSSENAVLEHADEIRAACLYAIGAYQARLGIPTAEGFLDQVAEHPRHASSVLRTRAHLALQRGDWAAAHAHQQAAEQYDMEHDSKQMFGRASMLGDIEVYALGLDLSAVKHLLGAIEPLAQEHAGWQLALLYGRAQYDALRGDHATALSGFDACARACEPASENAHPDAFWYMAEPGALEMLIELGRLEECLERGRRALRWGDGHPRGARYDGVQRMLAICEAALGQFDDARARLDACIAARQALGTRGLLLGLLYEGLCLTELWAGNLEAAEAAFERVRVEYLSCEASGFAGRFERLRQRVAAAGIGATGDAQAVIETSPRGRQDAEEAVSHALRDCSDAMARASLGLSLLQKSAGAAQSHLFLLQPSGVDLVASLPPAPPPPGLEAFVETRVQLELELERSEVATLTAALSRADDVASLAAPSVWTAADENAIVYHTVWIRATLAGQSTLVGVAALGNDAPIELRPAVVAIAKAFGDHLVRSGDTVLTVHVGSRRPSPRKDG